jgi:serine phosphatase RsbU (regulator of sigma subunit)
MKARPYKASLFGFAIGILGLLLSFINPIFSMEENTGLGLLFKLRGERPAPPEVVVVSIDKESADQLGISQNPDKWPRSLHARLTETLAREGARVVAFDVHFIEPKDPKDDALFARSLTQAENVVLCEPMTAREVSFGDGEAAAEVHSIVKIVKPISIFSEAALATAPFPLPRIPFKVNRYWAFQTGAGDSPTLPVVTFQLFTADLYGDLVRLIEKVNPASAGRLPADWQAAVQAKGVKGLIQEVREVFESDPDLALRMLEALKRATAFKEISDAQRRLQALIRVYGGPSSRYVNFYGPPRTVTTIPYYEALHPDKAATGGKPFDFKGKAVFVGLSESILADRKDSFYTVYSNARGLFVSGVEIAATAFGNILTDSPVRPVPFYALIAIVLLWGVGVGTLCRLYPIKITAPALAGLCIVYIAGAAVLFRFTNSWVPVIVPLFFQAPLAFLGAVGIEHSRLFREVLIKLRMEEDLTSAHDLQMGMLPAHCPEVEGYEIAASSTPAREVGGDFFDFIETHDSKVGFVVGDVTGKSVPGALIMAASRSVFRMLTEDEDLTVGQIMSRANSRVKKDAKSGMFVAALYAVLDPEESAVRFANAGQTQPIHYSALTSDVALVDNVGDNFPLGILDGVEYQVTEHRLAPGDKLVLYTDGVVEAMNKKGELFGFDRFLDVIKQSGSASADDLLKAISAGVAGFVKGAPQHDDLTVIVIAANNKSNGHGESSQILE